MAKKKLTRAAKVTNILKKPEFVIEPPSKRYEKTSAYREALMPLMKHKNKWALIARFSNTQSAGAAASFLRKDERFDVIARSLEDGAGLYARFKG